jgi:hypothetical protein
MATGSHPLSNFDSTTKPSPRFAINWPVKCHVAPSSCANMKLPGAVYECQQSIYGERNCILTPNDPSPLLHTFPHCPNPVSQTSSILPTRHSLSCVCQFRIPLVVVGTFECVLWRVQCKVVVSPCHWFCRCPTQVPCGVLFSAFILRIRRR